MLGKRTHKIRHHFHWLAPPTLLVGLVIGCGNAVTGDSPGGDACPEDRPMNGTACDHEGLSCEYYEDFLCPDGTVEEAYDRHKCLSTGSWHQVFSGDPGCLLGDPGSGGGGGAPDSLTCPSEPPYTNTNNTCTSIGQSCVYSTLFECADGSTITLGEEWICTSIGWAMGWHTDPWC